METHNNRYFAESSPNLKAFELLEAVIKLGRQFYRMPFHAPTLGIEPGVYYVVEVRRVEVPPIDKTLEVALPLPEYETEKV